MGDKYAPASDVTVGGFTTSTGAGTLTSHIDDEPYSDTDYIRSAPAAADAAQVALPNITDPDDNTGHVVHYRYAGQSSANLTVELVEGAASSAYFFKPARTPKYSNSPLQIHPYFLQSDIGLVGFVDWWGGAPRVLKGSLNIIGTSWDSRASERGWGLHHKYQDWTGALELTLAGSGITGNNITVIAATSYIGGYRGGSGAGSTYIFEDEDTVPSTTARMSLNYGEFADASGVWNSTDSWTTTSTVSSTRPYNYSQWIVAHILLANGTSETLTRYFGPLRGNAAAFQGNKILRDLTACNIWTGVQTGVPNYSTGTLDYYNTAYYIAFLNSRLSPDWIYKLQQNPMAMYDIKSTPPTLGASKVIKSWTHTGLTGGPGTFAAADQTLTEGEAATISNYGDLRLNFKSS